MLTLPPPALPSAECLVLGTICAPPSRVYTPTVQYASILRATSWGSGTVRRWDGRGGGARYWREDEISNGLIPERDSSWYLRICAAVSSFPASTTGESTIIQDKIPVCTLPNVPSGTGWAVGWTMGCVDNFRYIPKRRPITCPSSVFMRRAHFNFTKAFRVAGRT